MENTLPYTRFKQGASAIEIAEWVKTHRYVWYHAPMDSTPRKLYMTSQLKTWKRDGARWAVSVECHNGFQETLRFRIDETHADRIRIPHAQWWHGITARVMHEHDLGGQLISNETRGYLRRYGIWNASKAQNEPRAILATRVAILQSNGCYLRFDKLAHAVNFAKRKNIRLTAARGQRVRVLVAERAMNGEVSHEF
jgi:hypothetical protein